MVHMLVNLVPDGSGIPSPAWTATSDERPLLIARYDSGDTSSGRGEAILPCDIRPPDHYDEVRIVMWFKENYTSSVYSFDSRRRRLDEAEQTMDINILEGRAFFRYRDTPAVLTIENVRSSDAGDYLCRVDFGRSPTRKRGVRLSVTDPPEKLLVMDGQGSYVLGNTPRPYDEGSTATIKCISVGGRPLPRVTWWRDGKLVDDTFDVLSPDRVENTLTLERVGRHHFLSTLTCQASNNHQLAPLSRTVLLDMNLRPVQVRLLGERLPLSAGKKSKVQCEVLGSQPAPTVTWYLGSASLPTYRIFTDPHSNITSSTLFVTPTSDDNGKVLTCRAVNPLLANSSMEAKWTLDIHYIPTAKLKLGAYDKQEGFHEGSDVHFDCSIKSNPWVNKVIWKYNGKRLYNNSTMGVIVNNQSLVLHSITRKSAGSYVCVAENNEGYGESNFVYLDVKYAPVCRSAEPQVVGLSRRHAASLACRVDANPSDDVSFAWTFADTGESLDASSSSGTASLPPGAAMAHRTLLCTSLNEVGAQRQPCAFRLVPAVPPEPVRSCAVLERTAGSVKVKCSEGFSGGVPQQFSMDVFLQDSGSLVTSITSDAPSFAATGIDGALSLNISVYAFNDEGPSEVIILLIPPVSGNADLLASASIACYVAPVFGSLVGVVVVLGSTVAVITMLQRNKRRRRDGESSHSGGKATCSTIFGTPEDEFCSIPLREDGNSPTEPEPDVIQVKWGAYNQFVGKRQ